MLLPSPPSSASARRVLSARGCNRAPALSFHITRPRIHHQIRYFVITGAVSRPHVVGQGDRGLSQQPARCNATISISASSLIPSGATTRQWHPYSPVSEFFQVCCPTSRHHSALCPRYVFARPGSLAPDRAALLRTSRSADHDCPCLALFSTLPPFSSSLFYFPSSFVFTSFAVIPSSPVYFREKLLAQCFHRFVCVMSDDPLMNICSVGGNPVSAFLSWRLQATNACDVTLVWKSGYEHVAQYGISFK